MNDFNNSLSTFLCKCAQSKPLLRMPFRLLKLYCKYLLIFRFQQPSALGRKRWFYLRQAAFLHPDLTDNFCKKRHPPGGLCQNILMGSLWARKFANLSNGPCRAWYNNENFRHPGKMQSFSIRLLI